MKQRPNRPVIKKGVFLLFHFYGVIAFWKQTLQLDKHVSLLFAGFR